LQYLETIITGTYSVEVSYGVGCVGSDSIDVEIYTISPVDLGDNQAICTGSPLPLLNAGIEDADYAWTIDGNPIGTNDVELEVNLPGIYSVSVIEVDGCAGEDEVEVLVSEPSVFLGADINVCENEEFPILNALNQGSTYEWFFEGAIIPSETEQTLQTSQGGYYDVIITNQYGCSATDQIEVNTFPALNANFSGPPSATLGATVSFQDLTSPVVNSWTWNFGDGTPVVTQQNPSHAFVEIGPRPVFMVASNGICLDTAYGEVDVNWDCTQIGISAAFSTNTDTVVLSGLGNVECTNNSLNAEEYIWDFGDGTALDPTVDPIHVYSTEGTYTISLTVINYNCTTTTSQTIIVVPFGVGIEELFSDDDLLVYPNPNTGLFTVEVDLDVPSDINIRLNNILNQRAYQTTLANHSYWRKEFDLSSYVHGVYLLTVSTDTGVLHRRIIIE
jgi:PKD repeat protein